MKSVIGIISYLPDEEEVRKVRCDRCVDLIGKASDLFELPIILIAQNWTMDELKRLKPSTEVTVRTYQKLGITKAREILRRHFLATDYDYLICFDDDFEFVDNKELYSKYLSNLDGKNWVEYKNFLLNGLCLPRDIVEAEAFDLNNDPEAGTGYEDWIYVENLKRKYKDRYVKVDDYAICLKDRHTMTLDKYSTWKTNETKDQTEISWKKIKVNAVLNKIRESIESGEFEVKADTRGKELTKCIGIISWFPSDKKLRAERKRRCMNLLKTIDEHFKLPVLLVAQNWHEKDYRDLAQFKNQEIKVEKKGKLGITGARIELRRMYLEDTDYEYIILLDDDSELVIKDDGIENYLKEIDNHPNMFGVWRRGFPRLMAMSRSSYSKLSFDFIKGLEAERGEVWEDDAYHKVFCALYPNEVYQFTKKNLEEVSPFSEFDEFSTWDPTKTKQNIIASGWRKLVGEWIEYERSKQG